MIVEGTIGSQNAVAGVMFVTRRAYQDQIHTGSRAPARVFDVDLDMLDTEPGPPECCKIALVRLRRPRCACTMNKCRNCARKEKQKASRKGEMFVMEVDSKVSRV